MTIYELVNENLGFIRELVRAGILCANVERDLNLYHFYKCQLKETGSKMQAATNCEHAFKIKERQIFKIVKRYSQEFVQKGASK